MARLAALLPLAFCLALAISAHAATHAAAATASSAAFAAARHAAVRKLQAALEHTAGGGSVAEQVSVMPSFQ